MRLSIFPAALTALTLAFAVPGAARAELYDFAYTSTGAYPPSGDIGDFSGVFTVNSGVVTAITGSGSTIGAITGIIAPGGFAGNDNAFSSTQPYFDNNGLSFSTASAQYNVYYTGSPYVYEAFDSNGLYDSHGTLTVTAVPEPASILLLGSGLLALRARGRLRSRSV